MSTYNYAPGALHFDIHNNNISVSASQIMDLVRSFVPEDIAVDSEPTCPVTANPSPASHAPSYKPPYPREGDYNSVREYVEERKKYDPIFLDYCKSHNRTQLCERLTDEFGWNVNVDSYGKNVNRNL